MPRRSIAHLAAIASCLALASLPAGAATYPLKKSANGRYLVDARNAPFMIVGDSPQALMVNLTEAQAEIFFADREARGFNTLWVNLLCTTSTGGRADASTTDGILPFTATLPASSTYDLTAPNDVYFAHVERIVESAARHGLQLLLDPIETTGFEGTMAENGVDRCRAFGQYLGARYRDFDNILWMSGNDFNDWPSAYVDDAVRAVALGILDNDARHLQTVELNIGGSSSLDDPTWAPVIGLNATYTYDPTYARLLSDYARTPFLPNFMVEANYEYEGLYGPVTTAAVLRKQEYWSMTSGATGQMYGNGYTWPFLPEWPTFVDSPGAGEMRYLIALFAPRAWYDLVPDTAHTVLTAGYGTYATTGAVADNDYATAARTHDGRLIIVYTPVSRPLTVNMAGFAGPVLARWYDPTRGTYKLIPISSSSPPGARTFTPPAKNGAGDEDWVLVIESLQKPSRRPVPAKD